MRESIEIGKAPQSSDKWGAERESFENSPWSVILVVAVQQTKTVVIPLLGSVGLILVILQDGGPDSQQGISAWRAWSLGYDNPVDSQP